MKVIQVACLTGLIFTTFLNVANAFSSDQFISKSNILNEAQQSGFQLLGEHEGRLFFRPNNVTDKMTWYDAMSKCNSSGLQPVNYRTQDDFTFIVDSLRNSPEPFYESMRVGYTLKGSSLGGYLGDAVISGTREMPVDFPPNMSITLSNQDLCVFLQVVSPKNYLGGCQSSLYPVLCQADIAVNV